MTDAHANGTEQAVEPTAETFNEELEQVCARHNELFQRAPGYAVAMLLHDPDYRRSQHGLDVDIEEAGEGVWVVDLDDSLEVLRAAEDPNVLAELEYDFQIVGYGGEFADV